MYVLRFQTGYLTIAHSPLDRGDALIKGEEYALKAMMLDSAIAEVHAALAIASPWLGSMGGEIS